ncbi:hypothetical protein HELRODRAFT_175353 [Helobdella robusta]|uniref:Antistasin-like domain-containing protein n=1 Tax=Helobdella robusta TaxID=6412 RepID=T1F965_HELRO|nr:hypothetical protein HELRODRAFT_175353 [Helobdella robusta]ESO00858.1 hypothetical protein HELRODRAFT_175353 [Helobdella robusta]
MKLFYWSLVTILLLALDQVEAECPTCPNRTDPCQELAFIANDDFSCFCQLCINQCDDRFNFCGAGFQCVMNLLVCPANLSCYGIQSAACEAWSGTCPSLNCADNNCPRSGRLMDPNNCETCTCNNPCMELNCPEESPCYSFSVTPGREPNYQCGWPNYYDY